MSTRPSVIVCERRGHWAAGLRRHLPRDIPVRETRNFADCRRELVARPASLVVVEVARTNVAGALDLLVNVARKYPQARAAVVAERGCERYEWLMREAGAIHFISSPREADALAQLAVRLAARGPTPRTTLVAQIWDSLPWQELAVG
jgi:DNA-binding NtrC family response regulator